MKYITEFEIPQFGAVRVIELLPNGNLIMGSDDGLIKVFDPRNNFICVKELHQHTYAVDVILILKNKNILSRSHDKLILWYSETFSYKSLVGHNKGIGAAIQLNNEDIVYSLADNSIIQWDYNQYKKSKFVSSTIFKFILLSDNRLLGLAFKNIFIFDDRLNIIAELEPDRLVAEVFELNNRNLVCLHFGEKSFFEVYDSNLTDLGHKVDINEEFSELVLLRDTYIISAYKNNIVVWNINKGFEKQVFKYEWSFKRAYHLKDCLFVTTSCDNVCRVWCYTNQLKLIKTLEGHKGLVNYIRFIGNYFITVALDNACKVYKVESNE
jgi:WD40 repeat protein